MTNKLTPDEIRALCDEVEHKGAVLEDRTVCRLPKVCRQLLTENEQLKQEKVEQADALRVLEFNVETILKELNGIKNRIVTII